MSFTGTFGSAPGSLSMGAGRTRGRITGGQGGQGMNYPSPFFDIAHTYMPTSMKHLFRYCRYYFLTNPLVNATVFKLSEYPITDIIIDHENPQVKKRWTEYFHDHLQYRSFQIEAGLDYHTYGNCPTSLSFPFHKYLTCRGCNWSERADKIKLHWKFTNYDFRLTCPKCNHQGPALAWDHYVKNASGVRLLRWNVEDIEITYNDITGESTYFYTIPGPLRNDIVIGKKDVVCSTPQIFIQAIRQRKGVVLSKDNLFHLKRPTLAWQDRGWGTPLILPVLKDTFYLQIMKKAQEAILLEHIVPLRCLFPQAASGTSDPFTTINLVDWRDQVSQEIARWRFDNNYFPIMPIPIGQQSIGGDGKALLLFNEMQSLSEHIIMGMGVPREFLMGGLSYAGTNVSMRMLENAFISYVGRHRLMAQWVMKTVAHFMEWPEATVRFKPFKMADDLQRKAYLFQLNGAGKLSDTSLLADADYDMSDEDDIRNREMDKRLESTKKEQIAMAEVQGEQSLIMSKYQAKAQQAMAEAQMSPNAPGEPGGPGGATVGSPPMLPPGGGQPAQGMGGLPQEAGSQLGSGQAMNMPPKQVMTQGQQPDMMQMAQSYAAQIAELPPDQQKMALDAIAAQSSELAGLVKQFLAQIGGGQQQPANAGVGVPLDTRPNPEQLPPRRATPAI